MSTTEISGRGRDKTDGVKSCQSAEEEQLLQNKNEVFAPLLFPPPPGKS
jgi:hypothetical protein